MFCSRGAEEPPFHRSMSASYDALAQHAQRGGRVAAPGDVQGEKLH